MVGYHLRKTYAIIEGMFCIDRRSLLFKIGFAMDLFPKSEKSQTFIPVCQFTVTVKNATICVFRLCEVGRWEAVKDQENTYQTGQVSLEPHHDN